MEIKSYSNHHIDIITIELGNSFLWRFIGFYGHPETILGKNLENFFLFSIINLIFTGFVVVILMKFFLWMKKQKESFALKAKWIASTRL